VGHSQPYSHTMTHTQLMMHPALASVTAVTTDVLRRCAMRVATNASQKGWEAQSRPIRRPTRRPIALAAITMNFRSARQQTTQTHIPFYVEFRGYHKGGRHPDINGMSESGKVAARPRRGIVYCMSTAARCTLRYAGYVSSKLYIVRSGRGCVWIAIPCKRDEETAVRCEGLSVVRLRYISFSLQTFLCTEMCSWNFDL
jgi:hypothetical protein